MKKNNESRSNIYRYNLGDQKYTDRLLLITWWAITVICYVLSIEVLIGGKILTFMPLILFSVLITPKIQDKIKIHRYILIFLRILLLILTFYSVQF